MSLCGVRGAQSQLRRTHTASRKKSDTMVCDDCSRRLTTLAAPDPHRHTPGSSGGPSRHIGGNKALTKG